jgi:hypothetical protein
LGSSFLAKEIEEMFDCEPRPWDGTDKFPAQSCALRPLHGFRKNGARIEVVDAINAERGKAFVSFAIIFGRRCYFAIEPIDVYAIKRAYVSFGYLDGTLETNALSIRDNVVDFFS